jgi:hypothetical protein
LISSFLCFLAHGLPSIFFAGAEGGSLLLLFLTFLGVFGAIAPNAAVDWWLFFVPSGLGLAFHLRSFFGIGGMEVDLSTLMTLSGVTTDDEFVLVPLLEGLMLDGVWFLVFGAILCFVRNCVNSLYQRNIQHFNRYVAKIAKYFEGVNGSSR